MSSVRSPERTSPRMASIAARLLCSAAMSAGLAGAAHADETLRILTLNVWGRYDDSATSNFLINGNYDVMLFQEVSGTDHVSGLPAILEGAGLGTYVGTRTGSPGLISRLPGTLGTFTAPGIPSQGRNVPYTIVDGDGGRPATVVGSVHMDYDDDPTRRIAEAKAISEWARGLQNPFILAGDFNAGDVSERGLHRAEQQAHLFARTIVDGSARPLWHDLADEYIPDDRRTEFEAYAADMRADDGNGAQRYRAVLQTHFDNNRADYPGATSISDLSWRQWEAIIALDMVAKGLTFEDETYPVPGNTPQTMNVLKKQFQILQNPSEREPFVPHELGNGIVTWPSAGEDATNTWTSWDRVRIDHFLAARPFAKWWEIADDPNDPYLGIVDDVSIVTNPDGSQNALSDHEPVAHDVRWIGPRLEAFEADVNGAPVEKTRLAWDGDASRFEANNGVFNLSRNNMRTDVYLGQISDENGNPILTWLSDQEKKTLLDCASDDARLQKAIAEYCIDDHSFIGETLVADGGTVVVDEDAALGGSEAALVLDDGRLRIAGDRMNRLDRNVVLGAGGGAIDVAQAGNAVLIDREISGAGSLSKQGSGALFLDNTHSYTGATDVEAGVLVVNGSIAASSMTSVLDGGLLGGTGTIGNLTVASGGTLAPGNSIGTLTVAGDAIFEAGSKFAIETNPAGADSDQLTVTGIASLKGGSVAHVGATGTYDLRSAYTFLTAGTLEGKFDDVTSDFAFLQPRLLYDYTAGNVALDLWRNERAFASIAATGNQAQTAGAIDSIGFGANSPVFDAVAQLPDDSDLIRGVFDTLSGEVHASSQVALVEAATDVRNTVNNRIRGAFDTVAATPLMVMAYGDDGLGKMPGLAPDVAASQRATGWGTVFGSWGTVDGTAAAAGLDRSTGGVVAGLDGMLDTWRVGMLAGYSQTSFDVDDRASSGSADSFHLGVYGGTQWGAVGLRTGLAYTWHDIDTARSVTFPGLSEELTASYNAGTLQAFGELGYALDFEGARLEPFVNLAHVRHRSDGYTETGGSAALSATSRSTDTTFTTLGLRAETDFALGDIKATAHSMAGWRHAFGDVEPSVTQAFTGSDAFAITGAAIARNTAVIEAGLDFSITPAATLGVSYQGQYGSGSSEHGGRVGLNVKF